MKKFDINYKDGREFKLKFKEEGHSYYILRDSRWRKLLSASEISGVSDEFDCGFGEALIRWSARKAAEASTELLEWGPDDLTIPERELYISNAWERDRDDAGYLGTLFHEWAESVFLGEERKMPLGISVSLCSHFEDWWKEQNIEIEDVEMFVYSASKDYVGRLDALGRKGSDYVIIDIKTGKYVKGPKESIQVAGYALAAEEQLGIDIREGLIYHIPVRGERPPNPIWINSITLNEAKEAFERNLANLRFMNEFTSSNSS